MAMAEDTLVERLRTLGVFPDTPQSPNSVRENANILAQCATLDEIGSEVATRRFSVSAGQFVFYHLQALLQQHDYEQGFMAHAKEKLGGLGIQPAHIAEYFQSTNPGLVFDLKHEDVYGRTERDAFYEKANQFALDSLREWMGIPLANRA